MKSAIYAIVSCIFLLSGFSAAEAKGIEGFAPIVKKVDATVVNIYTTQTIKNQRPYPDIFRDFFGDQLGPRGNSPDLSRQSLGSGVVISADGYILTNNHVIKDASAIKVKLYHSKEDLDAKVVGKDPKIDIALLKIEPKTPLPFATLGDSDSLEVGDWVLAIGNPFGLAHTVTKGIVSAKGRVIGSGPYDDFIQIDVPINPGNSGGPLFDTTGVVVGINTAIVASGQGIGFAIPVNMIKAVLEQLKKGSITRGWLGVRVQEVTKELAESFGLNKPEGALIAEVFKNSPAEKAGVKEGDVLIEVDGKRIEDAMQLPKMVANVQPNQKIRLKLIREKKELVIDAVLSKMEDEENPDVYEELGLKLSNSKNGVLVEEITPNSPAHIAGIAPGDYIIRAGNVKIDTVDQLLKLIGRLKSNSIITLQLKTKMGSKFVTLRKP